MISVESNTVQTPLPTWRLRLPSATLGIVYCIVFTTFGHVSDVCSEAYHSLNVPSDWRIAIIDATHLGRSLPLAVIVAILLVLKDRSLARKTADRLNMTSF